MELIKHAAVKGPEGLVFFGKCHADCFYQAMNVGLRLPSPAENQGFFTSRGRFVTRSQAHRIAAEAGQIKNSGPEILFSEMLWSPTDDGQFEYDSVKGYF